MKLNETNPSNIINCNLQTKNVYQCISTLETVFISDIPLCSLPLLCVVSLATAGLGSEIQTDTLVPTSERSTTSCHKNRKTLLDFKCKKIKRCRNTSISQCRTAKTDKESCPMQNSQIGSHKH